MAVAPTIWDQANLQQVTQGGGALLDYLNHNRAVEDEQRQAGTKLNSALALQEAENRGGVQRVEAAGRLAATEGNLNRESALKVVAAQEHARVAATRSAAISGLQARYPRKENESDDDYIERVGKEQAIGPNKIYKQMILKQESVDRKSKELEDSVEKLLADENKVRSTKVSALARTDPELDTASKKAGYETIPYNVPNAIAVMRATKGGESKAAELETAWQNSLTRADTQEKVPFSPELGVRIRDLKDQIQRVKISGDRQLQQLGETRLKMLSGLVGKASSYLEFSEDEPAGSPLGPPAGLAPPRVAPDASGRKSALQEYLDSAAASSASPGGSTMPAVLPNAIQGSAGDPLTAYLGTLQNGLDFAGRKASSALQSVGTPVSDALTRFGASLQPAAEKPALPWTNTVPTSLTGDAQPSGLPWVRGDRNAVTQGRAPDMRTARIMSVFGPDALPLLEKAKALATSRGMSEAEQTATFNKALSGDPQAIAGVQRVLGYLRQERDNPQDDLSPVTPGQ